MSALGRVTSSECPWPSHLQVVPLAVSPTGRALDRLTSRSCPWPSHLQVVPLAVSPTGRALDRLTSRSYPWPSHLQVVPLTVLPPGRTLGLLTPSETVPTPVRALGRFTSPYLAGSLRDSTGPHINKRVVRGSGRLEYEALRGWDQFGSHPTHLWWRIQTNIWKLTVLRSSRQAG